MTDAAARLASALADRYRIERELGAGGMATVYLAYDVRHDRRVALKVLRPELAAVIGADRFLAEIRTTANLQHPHILPLFDSGTVDGTVYYAMPFVAGEALGDRLRRERQLPIAEAVRIATQVAGALDYAHRHGVIHRDIKPDNVLLHDGSALVADFGIALAASRSEGSSRMTETGLSLGTPPYMSPEQAMGERGLDARTDVYALGCMLYEMLAGVTPFDGPNARAVVARVISGEPAPVTTFRRMVPPHVAAAVHTAIQKLPADRFETAASFAEALSNPAARVHRTALAETRVPLHANGPALLFAAIAALATAAVLWFGLFSMGSADDPVAIAVLPCEDHTGDATLEHLAPAFAENLANRLTKIGELHVVTRGEVRIAQREAPGLGELARTVGASHLVTCDVRGAGDSVRISAQLLHMRATPPRELWADAGAAAANNVLAVEDALSRGVVGALPTLRMTESEQRALATGETRDGEAQMLVVLGWVQWHRFTPGSMPLARTYFERAIERDSTYAEAWAGLAAVDIAVGATIGTEPMRAALERARAVVANGLRLIPDDPILLMRRASVSAWYDRNLLGAQTDAARALALRPGYAPAHQTMQHVLAALGEFDAALAHSSEAIRLDPADPRLHTDRATYLFLARRFDEAGRSAGTAIALDSLSATGFVWQAYAAAFQGKPDQAIDAIGRATTLAPTAQYLTLDRAIILGSLGRLREARGLVEPLASDSTSRDAALIAAALGILGERDRAFEWLERALRDGSRWLVTLAYDPRFDPLRGDPRFQNVLRRARRG